MTFEDLLVSGAPATTYALPGSLFEFHDTVMKPGTAKSAGIEALFELYGGAYYRHTANADMMVDPIHPWSQSLLEQYNNERHCQSAASVVLRIKDATIEKSVIYCRNGEKFFILYESFRAPDRAASNFSAASMRQVEFANFQRSGAAYFYLGSAGSFNYGHWLIDDLPRARALIELKRKFGIDCVVLLPSFGEAIDKVRVESLKCFVDSSLAIEFFDPANLQRIHNLYYVTPVSFHPRIKNPSAIQFIRTQAMMNFSSPLTPGRKIFVARRPPNSRSIINFDDLWAFLQSRGFEMIEAEKLNFAEQVRVFQSAQIVVGQMGAAMTNTIFCQPGTNLIYLAPVGWAEPFYLDLAALGGQQYNILVCHPNNEGPAYLADFSVPIDQLYHRLTYMGFNEIANI